MRVISYLDLICCAFCGALLLFLIVASASVESAPPKQLLIVRAISKLDVDGEPASVGEIGIEFRQREEGAEDEAWKRAFDVSNSQDPDAPIFFSSSLEDGGNISILVWESPPKGTWEFRPYLANSSYFEGTLGEVAVRLEAMTPAGIVRSPEPDRLLSIESGKPISIRVSER